MGQRASDNHAVLASIADAAVIFTPGIVTLTGLVPYGGPDVASADAQPLLQAPSLSTRDCF